MISNERLESKLASDLSDYIVKWLKENNPSPTESCSKFDSVISLQQRIYQLEAENAQLKESGSNKRLKMSAKEVNSLNSPDLVANINQSPPPFNSQPLESSSADENQEDQVHFRQQSDNRKPQQQTVSALKLRYEMEAKQRSSSDPTVTKASRPRSLPVSRLSNVHENFKTKAQRSTSLKPLTPVKDTAIGVVNTSPKVSPEPESVKSPKRPSSVLFPVSNGTHPVKQLSTISEYRERVKDVIMDYELNKDMLIIRQNTKQLCSERLGSEFVLVASELALQNPSSSRRVVTQLLSLALRERIISSSDINEALSVIFKSSHTLDPTFWTSLGQVINNVFDDICITGL